MMEEKKEESGAKKGSVYAAVRIRGAVHTTAKMKDAAQRLKLIHVNNCVIVPSDPTHKGMLMSAGDHITWGEVNKETLEKMIEKRGRNVDGSKPEPKKAKSMTEKIIKNGTIKGVGLNPVFRLSPPSKGLKSVRLHFPRGDLGYRGEEINNLLKRMI